MSYLIGIDIGTSGAKAVVMEREGHLVSAAGSEYPIDIPRQGWAEQDPKVWLEAAIRVTRQAVQMAGIDPHLVSGIGLAGQMHSLVCIDTNGNVLRPAILWADQRSARQVRSLTSRFGQENLAAWTGNPLAAGFMLASWAWILENEPHLAAQTRWLMLPKDWVRYQFTGQVNSDPSDASATLLFDPHQLSWSEPILRTVGLDQRQLPPVKASHALAGYLLPEIAAGCGLPEGIPVAMGCSDVSAQALAMGIVEPGTVSVTIGTGGQLFAPVARPRHDPALRMHLFCHALPDTWHQEAAILSAGLALRWLRDNICSGMDYGTLADAAAGVDAAMDGLYFFPYLNGERTPYMDPGLRAAYIGLELRHKQPHLVRAAMEGVVFAMRQGLDLMIQLDTPVKQLVASGGANRHPLWMQLQADIFNRPLAVYDFQEATARGAALLAGVASGMYQDVRHALRLTVREPAQWVEPNPVSARRYAFAYREFQSWSQILADRYRVGEIR
jgi:xylulokinase